MRDDDGRSPSPPAARETDRRRTPSDAIAYLRSERIFYALHHPFLFSKGQLPLDDYLGFALRLFPALEVRNGTMLAAHNEPAEAIVRQWSASSPIPLTAIGGSGADTLGGIGTTYTEAPETTRDEFLQSLRARRAPVVSFALCPSRLTLLRPER